MPRIDLNSYRSPQSKSFSGRDRGSLVRKNIGESQLDEATEIFLDIPADVRSISSSFFLGLFGKTIRKFGADKFKEMLKPNTNRFDIPIEQAIREAVQTDVLL